MIVTKLPTMGGQEKVFTLVAKKYFLESKVDISDLLVAYEHGLGKIRKLTGKNTSPCKKPRRTNAKYIWK